MGCEIELGTKFYFSSVARTLTSRVPFPQYFFSFLDRAFVKGKQKRDNCSICCIIMIMNDACDDVARVRDEREKIHQYRTERERARTLLSYVKRIP